jgi:hypothetical protein
MIDNDYYLPLNISLTPSNIRHHYEATETLPAHDLVIKTLLDNCKEAYVYGIKKESELFKNNANILISDKGKFKFDTTKECLKGHEYLWNVTGWKRGSIVIILERDKINFSEIFRNCYRPGLCATPNSGNSLSATKKCKEAAAENNMGICFPASNGIEWIQIYASQELTNQLLQNAKNYCQEKDYYSIKQ